MRLTAVQVAFIGALPGVFVGCGVGLRAEAYAESGGLDRTFFMQAEEYDLSFRLAVAGWEVGRNLRIETRWSGGDPARLRKNAADLVALNPDVIMAGSGPTLPTILRETRTVPIVFAQSIDPIGSGSVRSLAQPGGNATGFLQFEYDLSGKWLELLKEIVPRTARAAVLRDPARAPGIGQFAAIQSVAPSLGIELNPVDVRDPAEIERAVAAFAGPPNNGLIVTASPSAAAHRDAIIALAARHRLPAVYPLRYFVVSGGLISYGPESIDPFRRAAGYVDRILKGEKPAELPVMQPTRFEFVINLKTAKALGLAIPPMLLARADEAID
jgi:putative ABC transport system substrate-binding protein